MQNTNQKIFASLRLNAAKLELLNEKQIQNTKNRRHGNNPRIFIEFLFEEVQ